MTLIQNLKTLDKEFELAIEQAKESDSRDEHDLRVGYANGFERAFRIVLSTIGYDSLDYLEAFKGSQAEFQANKREYRWDY